MTNEITQESLESIEIYRKYRELNLKKRLNFVI